MNKEEGKKKRERRSNGKGNPRGLWIEVPPTLEAENDRLKD
jgi:hypothetical protein